MPQSQKTLEFLQKLKDKGHWNDDYDYSEVDYVDNNKKVIVIRKDFKTKHLMNPSSFLRGSKLFLRNAIDKTEFAKCVIRQQNDINFNLDDFIYISDKQKFKLRCPKHILAISKDRNTFLVVELKKGRVSDNVVGQIQRYMGYVKEDLAEPHQEVKGIIIGSEDDLRNTQGLVCYY